MNILVLNYEYPPLGGGAAPVSRDISEQLANAGNKVTVVTMGFNNLPYQENRNGVDIFRLKCWRSKKSSCMPWEQFTYILAAKKFLRKHLQDNHYDICHTHFIIPTGDVAKWVKEKYNIPVVITAHGSDVEGYNSKKYMKIMHFFLRFFWRDIVNHSYKIISPSRFLEKLMLKAYNRSDKYVVIPNGLEISKYKALANADKKEKRILLMGRMQRSKNMQTSLKAISMVNLGDWRVDILGDGPYREKLEILVDELKLRDKVTFYGWLENGSKDQLDLLSKASIYITASEFENCPMAVIETIAGGCYPLLSDIEAHRLLVPDDEFYFEPHDVQRLSEKLQNRIDIGEANYAYDLDRYDWSKVIKQYNVVFEEAIKFL